VYVMYSDQSYSVDCVTTVKQFAALEQSWNQLLIQSIHPQPFLLWEWVYTWWEIFQKEQYELLILVVKQQDELVGLAPFYIDNSSYLLPGRLRMLGEGEAHRDEIVSHYPDVICSQDHRTGVTEAIGFYLLSRRSRWNTAKFRFMLEDAVLNDVYQALSGDFNYRAVNESLRYVIDLPAKPEDYLDGLSQSMRKQFRSRQARMQRYGDIAIYSRNQLRDQYGAFWILERLHRARWKTKFQQGIYDSAAFRGFHRALLARLESPERVDIRVMYHDGDPIAAVHNFKINRCCYSYQSGFKSSDDKRFSPMLVFDIMEIQQLIAQGYRHYDYLSASGDNSYKRRFQCHTSPVHDIRWVPCGALGIMVQSYYQLKAFVKAFRKRWSYWLDGKSVVGRFHKLQKEN